MLRLVCFARLDCTLSKSHDSVLFAAELIFNLPAICIESTNLVRHRYASIAARSLVRIGNATANGGVGVSSASTGRALHSATGAYEIPMSGVPTSPFLQCEVFRHGQAARFRLSHLNGRTRRSTKLD